MTRWTGTRVAGVLGTTAPEDVAFTGISTDSRSVHAGELFVALEGPRFDGHRFLDQAVQAGARGAVVRRGTRPRSGLVLFEVESTLVALGDLARSRRQEILGPVVAVTGSNGKTATRAMLAGTLGTRWATQATRENLNNLVGVPLTILAAPDSTEADLPAVRPVMQKRVWDRFKDGAGPEAMAEVIRQLRSEDDRFHMEGGSWTNNVSWVRGYESVLGPMESASALFAERMINRGVSTSDSRYRNALYHLMMTQTSCYRYWGQGRWTDYARELCRRTVDILLL